MRLNRWTIIALVWLMAALLHVWNGQSPSWAEAWSITADAENDIVVTDLNGEPYIDINDLEELPSLDCVESAPLTDLAVIEPSTAITIHIADDREVSLEWSSGVLDLVGDPNDYTEAAKLFFLHAIPHAISELLPQMAADGTICEAIGHKWSWGFNGNLVYSPGYQSEQCTICQKTRSRHLTEWE